MSFTSSEYLINCSLFFQQLIILLTGQCTTISQNSTYQEVEKFSQGPPWSTASSSAKVAKLTLNIPLEAKFYLKLELESNFNFPN